MALGIALAGVGPIRAEHVNRPSDALDPRPDVLFIIVDDMNDWVSLLNDDSPIPTPHLKRLAARGVSFSKAYCASPACNPSRTATLTGLRPTTTGVYGNATDWRRAIPHRKTIMQQFMAAGYDVRGAGKIFHHQLDGAFHDDASFDDFQPMRPQSYPEGKLNQAPEYGSRNTDWGAWPPRTEDSIDFQTISYCREAWEKQHHAKPLFLACGIYRPHSPFFSPADFSISTLRVNPPSRNPRDWEDLPGGAAKLLRSTRWFWDGMMELESRRSGSFRRFVNAYATCAAFADAQIGRLLDAIDASGRADSTIVVLWSDHGFHLGEKNHIEKFALWEKTTRVPFIIVAPGVATPGRVCDRPVDLSAVFPTLLELARLPAHRSVDCDGISVVPLLQKNESAWDHPALMTYMPGNHAVRSDRYRYIRYADGSEELYDHSTDPNEWNNLALDPAFESVKKDHRRWLPTNEKPIGRRMARPE